MAEIIPFQHRKQTSKAADKATVTAQAYPNTFEEALEVDIQNYSDATGMSRDQVIEHMLKLYRRYPMLIEHVRSPEVLLKK